MAKCLANDVAAPTGHHPNLGRRLEPPNRSAHVRPSVVHLEALLAIGRLDQVTAQPGAERLAQTRERFLGIRQRANLWRQPVLDEVVGDDDAPRAERSARLVRALDAAHRAIHQCPLNGCLLEHPCDLERRGPGWNPVSLLVAMPAMHCAAQHALAGDFQQLEATRQAKWGCDGFDVLEDAYFGHILGKARTPGTRSANRANRRGGNCSHVLLPMKKLATLHTATSPVTTPATAMSALSERGIGART